MQQGPTISNLVMHSYFINPIFSASPGNYPGEYFMGEMVTEKIYRNKFIDFHIFLKITRINSRINPKRNSVKKKNGRKKTLGFYNELLRHCQVSKKIYLCLNLCTIHPLEIPAGVFLPRNRSQEAHHLDNHV